MTRKEVERSFESIVAFAELDEYIDQPVKHYSSGMYLRLAFAVAVHTNPEILLVDEILAVGDAAFQQKCRLRLNQMKAAGTTIVLITHDMQNVLDFCDRALFLEKGHVQIVGRPDQVVEAYGANSPLVRRQLSK